MPAKRAATTTRSSPPRLNPDAEGQALAAAYKAKMFQSWFTRKDGYGVITHGGEVLYAPKGEASKLVERLTRAHEKRIKAATAAKERNRKK